MLSVNDILSKVSLWKTSPSQLTEMPLIADAVLRISLLAETPLVAAVLSKISMYKSSLPPFSFTEVSPWTVVRVAISALILKLIITWVYRIFFHPLAKYPGPWTAKVSDFYTAYHNGKGQLHIQTKIGHEKYGAVFRQGPNKLVFNSSQALHDIYSSKEVQKSFAYEALLPGPGQYNIFTVIDSTAHRHKSKMLSQAFSDRNMKEFEPTMIHHIDLFVKSLMSSCDETASTWSIPIDMTRRSGYLQYDVMGKFGFGSSFDMQTKSDNHFLLDVVDAICLTGGIFTQYPKLALLPINKLMVFSKIAEMRAKYSTLVTRLVRTRVAAPKNFQPDIFKFLVDATNPETGKGFTEAELWAESRFLLIAGADTSKTALSALFYYLSAYPECYEKLVDEIRSTFKSGDEIRAGPKMASCQYLKACIDEMLRMSTPIASTLWREVAAAGGIEVDGHHIPKGTDLGVNPYAIHHNETIFPNSGTYMPERWIASEDNPQESINRARHAFQPFSLGTRACAGRAFAAMELSNTIVKTLWHMNFRRAEGALGLVSNGIVGGPEGRDNPKEFQLEDHLTCAHEGPYLQFQLREGLEKNLVTTRES